MRSRFDELLTLLNNSLIEMGALIERAISQATQALLEQDAESAKRVMDGDEIIDEKEKEIESQCLKLLLHQHPVARDLRQISTALKMITDMERIGDQAADISEIVLMMNGSLEIPQPAEIQQMADATIRMVTRSIDAYVRRDAMLAQEVIASDDEVDDYFVKVRERLVAEIAANAALGEHALDLFMIAKYFERIGDHATNIAGWVYFSITGKHKENHS